MEVVISIAIIGIVFTAFFSLFSLSSKTARISTEKTDLTVVAQGLMERSLYQEGFTSLGDVADGSIRDISASIPTEYGGRYSAQRIVSYVEGSDNKLLKIIIRTRDLRNPAAGTQISLVTLLSKG